MMVFGQARRRSSCLKVTENIGLEPGTLTRYRTVVRFLLQLEVLLDILYYLDWTYDHGGIFSITEP
jgi:hypothetical protein